MAWLSTLVNPFPFVYTTYSSVIGSVYGAFQGYARAFYAELLPPGEEAQWYGLFSITDKVLLPSHPPVFTDYSSVELFPWSSGCRSDFRCDWKYPIFHVFPCRDDLARRAYPVKHRCRAGKERCTSVPPSERRSSNMISLYC